jgi:hypothetical protein
MEREGRSLNSCQVFAVRDSNGRYLYVGQTRNSQPVTTRLGGMLKGIWRQLKAKQPLSKFQMWLYEQHICKGVPIKVELLQTDGRWELDKAAWILRLKQQGHRLMNVDCGYRL